MEPQQKIRKVVVDEIPTFLAKFKTELEFATHLRKFNPNTASQNIETLFASKKRQKLLRVIPASEWGREADKYVLRT